MPSIRINIDFPVEVKNEGSYFLASCMKLDVHAEGKTHDEALKNILEALEVFVTACIEMGSLETVLKDSGFRKVVQGERSKPNLHEETVSVPISLLAANGNGQAKAYAN